MKDSNNPYGADIGPDTPIGDVPDASNVDDGGDEQDEMPDDAIIVDASVSCDECSHQDVCAVYANFAPQVAQEIPERTGGDPAFDPASLAVICDHFDQM